MILYRGKCVTISAQQVINGSRLACPHGKPFTRTLPYGTAHIMSPAQYFPIPPELFAHACTTVTNRVSQLPFLRGGINVTGELVGVSMECLNAPPTKARTITTPQGTGGGEGYGLDRCLEERLHIPGKTAAPVIAEVLCSAGIAEPALIPDRHAHRQLRGIRLLPPWTWHIASTLTPSVRLGDYADGAAFTWLDLCPVCRTGILDKVTGKQLFGIPRTDFYLECSHCGAKFIPVGTAFRLVSIARIKDPLWKGYLDRTYPPETWAAIARGPGPAPKEKNTLPAAVKKTPPPALPPAGVTLTSAKDGSLAVPLLGKTLFFRPVPLRFVGGVREDTFTRVQTPLMELLQKPGFEHLRIPVNAKYSRYLPLKTGLFLGQLKERHDPFYREFLNQYGDEKFGTFRAEGTKDTEKRGVFMIVVNHGLYFTAGPADPLGTAINHFGRIGPDDCLLSGDSTRCRINALLSAGRSESGVYVHAVENEEVRHAVADAAQKLASVGQSGKQSDTQGTP